MTRTTKPACLLMALAVLVAVTGSACGPPAVNPWVDDSIPPPVWTSPSQDGVLATNAPMTLRQRDWPETPGPYVSRETPHYPLWWEDPFEDKGDGDGRFAWTWADYVALPYSPGRYLLNTVAWPVSAVVTPPGVSMVSDGVIGRDHDARRGTSPDPAAGPGDFGYADSP